MESADSSDKDSSEEELKASRQKAIRLKEEHCKLFDVSSGCNHYDDFPYFVEPVHFEEQLQWCPTSTTSYSESDLLPENILERHAEKIAPKQTLFVVQEEPELLLNSNDHLQFDLPVKNEALDENEVQFADGGREMHSYYLVEDPEDDDMLKNKGYLDEAAFLEKKDIYLQQSELTEVGPFTLDQFSSPSKFIELQISEAEGSVQDGLAEAEIELDTSRPCPQCDLDLSNEDYFEHLKTSHSNIRLGCPQCPLTFVSPELLNTHYKHDHHVKTQSRTPSRGVKSKSRFDCPVCQKTYGSQRAFSNHKRRKDFCKPPVVAEVPPKRRIGIIRRSL